MKITPAEHPDIKLIEPDVHGDGRGFFIETWQQERYADAGIPGGLVQDNHSRSGRGVLRGLHYQLEHPQGKLIRVACGRVLDVAVDVRRGSPRFGQYVAVELSDENHNQVYIPPGFAHGFCVLSETADFIYKCTDYYRPDDEYGIAWDDPDIGIDWPSLEFQLSDRDRQLPRLAESQHLPAYSDNE